MKRAKGQAVRSCGSVIDSMRAIIAGKLLR